MNLTKHGQACGHRRVYSIGGGCESVVWFLYDRAARGEWRHRAGPAATGLPPAALLRQGIAPREEPHISHSSGQAFKSAGSGYGDVEHLPSSRIPVSGRYEPLESGILLLACALTPALARAARGEPRRDHHALDAIRRDLEFLLRHGRQLFIQLQDVSFDDGIINVPDYLLEDPAFHGGAARQYAFEDDDQTHPVPAGWVARRWDPAVRERFARLLQAIAAEFDGRIAGLNLPETSVSFGHNRDLWAAGYSPSRYVAGLKDLMATAAGTFHRSDLILYANFMPGEELPRVDNGYLKGLYAQAAALGCGVGGPDLLPHRWFQQHNSLPLIAHRAPGVVAGMAVQWGNLDDIDPATKEPVTVGALAEFARDVLRLDYLFRGTQEPYYSRDILPYLEGLGDARIKGRTQCSP